MYNHGMALSLNDNTFVALKDDFDNMIGRTIGNMEMKGADEATITIKLTVSLEKTSVTAENGVRDITRPTFKHDISSVMQVKDKMSGQLKGDYELVYDKESGTYYMQRVEDGQMDMFGPDMGDGKVIDASFCEVKSIGEGQRGLPGGDLSSESIGESRSASDDADDGAEDAGRHSGGNNQEPNVETPFGWLNQFIGQTMNVTEAMGNYTVRTKENKVVLSSATGPNSIFYAPAEKLAPHVGHTVKCVGYGDDKTVNISVECTDCGEVLFDLDRSRNDEGSNDGEDGPDDYGYNAPESDDAEEVS